MFINAMYSHSSHSLCGLVAHRLGLELVHLFANLLLRLYVFREAAIQAHALSLGKLTVVVVGRYTLLRA